MDSTENTAVQKDESSSNTQEQSKVEQVAENTASKTEGDVSPTNICDDTSESGLGTPDTDFAGPEISCLDVHEKEGSLERMMNECSSVAQHIKETIHRVLSSRECPVNEQAGIQLAELMLQENIQERIADLEKVIQTSTTVAFDDAILSSKEPDPSEEKSSGENQDDNPVDQSSTESKSFPAEKQLSSSKNSQSNGDLSSENSKQVIAVKEDLAEEETFQDFECEIADSGKDTTDEKSKSPKKSIKESASIRRKNEKSLEHLMKSLASYGTTEEKLDALYKKHVKLLEDLRAYENKCKLNERHILQLTREKEQLQSDHNRTVLAKSRLESLCRELQRQNKAVKEESLLRIREEEEKRKEVASKFQATLNDISTLMQENHHRNANLREENTELAQKLKALMDHYEKWEKHMEKVVRQKELEAQLAKAKFAKVTIQQRQEREQYLVEKKQLLETVSELQKRCTELTGNEVQLRTELEMYTSKYEEFQSVLNKSNEVFSTFKDDMANMSKKIKKLEKETGQWKTRWENSNRALLEMAADKQQRDRELIAAHQKILTLEKLCRALQGERIELQNKLKEILPENSASEVPMIGAKDAEANITSTEEVPSTHQQPINVQQ